MSTPKERFIASGNAAAFAKLAASEAFEPACDYALLQLHEELPVNCQPGMEPSALLGFDANAQIVGAKKLIEILKHLHEPVKPTANQITPRLHY